MSLQVSGFVSPGTMGTVKLPLFDARGDRESAHDAAVRELAEETGIRAHELALVAGAEYVLGSEATRHWAAVFNVTFDAPPVTEANEEMADFRWWTVNTDLWEGLSPLDAEVARRCLPRDFAPPAIR